MALSWCATMIAARAAAQTPAPPVAVTGTFHIIWRDAAHGGAIPGGDRRYVLIDDHGAWYDVQLDSAALTSLGGERALDRRRVTIGASEILSPARAHTAMPQIRARTLRLETLHAAGAVSFTFSGPQPYVTILCRFQDTPVDKLPSKSMVQTLAGGSSSYPSLDNYYREVSNGAITLAGSRVVGWYDLPHARAYYVVNSQADLQKLTADCTAAADKDVDFTAFRGINMQFSDQLDCCSWGGTTLLTLDGQTRAFGVTWIAAWGVSQAAYGHEMGHSFGFPHSHGPYGQTYDSKWDIMSYTYDWTDPTYGSIGPHTIAFHKALAGWIPAARRFVAKAGTSTITIERSAQPASNGNYLMAEIPIPGTSEHYTLEARRFTGQYDAHLPGQAIIIHRCGVDATVIDADGNGNPNDNGAMWVTGETFTDAAHNIAVTVGPQVGNGWQVTIRDQVTATTPLSIALGAAGRRDTTFARASVAFPDSVRLTLSGTGASSAHWSAARKAAWLVLAATSGTGSGMLRWQHQAHSLAAGTYVDTISVTASGATGSPARFVDTLVVLAQPRVEDAAAALLGTTTLSAPAARYLDAQGNGNGTFDLGDFLALASRTGASASGALAAARANARDTSRATPNGVTP